MALDLRSHANTELEDFEDLKQGVGMRNRFETLIRKLLQSTLNRFGSAARRDAGSAAGQIPLLGAGGLLVRARWPARLAASSIRGVLAVARIGNHNATKAAQGTFRNSQIPSLDAGIFTRGRFQSSQIPAGVSATNSWFSSTESINNRTAGTGNNPDSGSAAVFNDRFPTLRWTRITGCSGVISSTNKLTITITQAIGGTTDIAGESSAS